MGSSFLLFLTIIISLLIFFDLYLIISWVRFSKKRKYKKYTYYIPIIIFAIMLGLMLYSGFYKESDVNDKTAKVLFALSSVWFLPTILITPLMMVKDLIRLSVFLLKKAIRFIQYKNGNSNGERVKSNLVYKIIQNIGWIAVLIPFFIYIYGTVYTVRNYQIKSINIPIVNLPNSLNGLKIVQLSDIHSGSFYNKSEFEKIRFLVNSLKPDLILFTGDYVNSNPDEFSLIKDEITSLKAEYGIYGCLGNHDHYMTTEQHKKLIKLVEESGINLLINENITLNIKGEPLQIAAVDNSSYRLNFADLNKALNGLIPGLATILLSHDPKIWEQEVLDKKFIDLTLSGHTHGGQVSLDFTGHYYIPAQHIFSR